MSNNQIIETRTCRISGKEFTITQQDADFYKKISPKFSDYIAEIPFPTLCPEERAARRLVFRNERKLYRRECDATQRQIISIYQPGGEYVVYDQKVWRSDSWDGMDYGRQFDFSKSFTEQFDELGKVVPRPSLFNFFGENSEYCNCSSYQKNCYMTSSASTSEECMYSAYIIDCKDVLDSTMVFNCETCYGCIDCEESSRLLYGNNCKNCSDSWFLVNCTGCTHCIACNDLENASYCIGNKQYTKDEYIVTKEKLLLDTKALHAKRSTITQGDTCHQSEDVIGDHLRNCKNCVDCYDSVNLEDCKYTIWFYDAKDCYDVYARGQGAQLCYESVALGDQATKVLFCSNVDATTSNMLYSLHCQRCSDCFGCMGLKDKQYCVFNTQYTKEEYEKLVPQIIEHMKTTGERGEFFDPSLSPFGYNETGAYESYPISQSQAIKKGFKRSTYEAPIPKSSNITKGSDLPTIEDVTDDILQTAIECEVTGKLFRIQPRELAFYRKYGISLPSRHPDQRHMERLEMRK